MLCEFTQRGSVQTFDSRDAHVTLVAGPRAHQSGIIGFPIAMRGSSSQAQVGANSLWLHRASPDRFIKAQHRSLRNVAPAAMTRESPPNPMRMFQQMFEAPTGVTKPKPTERKKHVRMVNTEQEFDTIIDQSTGCVLIGFTSNVCKPCKAFAPTYEKMAAEYSEKATFLSMNAQKNKEVRTRLNVRSVPSFYLFRGGKMVAMETQFKKYKTEFALRSLLDECALSA